MAEIQNVETKIAGIPEVRFRTGESNLGTGWTVTFENPRNRRGREVYSVERIDKDGEKVVAILRSFDASGTT